MPHESGWQADSQTTGRKVLSTNQQTNMHEAGGKAKRGKLEKERGLKSGTAK